MDERSEQSKNGASRGRGPLPADQMSPAAASAFVAYLKSLQPLTVALT